MDHVRILLADTLRALERKSPLDDPDTAKLVIYGSKVLGDLVRGAEVGDLVVLCERHAPRLGEYIASAKIDPPVSLVRVHRADLVAAVEEEGRQGRIGCVGCWDTLQKRVYAEAPRWPGLADVGRETKA